MEEKSVEDMDMCPRDGSYARSSDNYTHMGTMPRFLLRKNKDSKKNKAKSELRRNQSQRQPADYVCDSPLLSALSSQGASAVEPPSCRSQPDQANPTQSAPAEPTESPSPVNPAASPLNPPVSPYSSSQPALAKSTEEWTANRTLRSSTPKSNLDPTPQEGSQQDGSPPPAPRPFNR